MSNGNNRHILVTGATGAAGPALVNQLLKKGYHVRIFSRHCRNYKKFPGEVERCPGDILDPEAVFRAMKDIDAVFHLAARLHDIKGRSPEKVYRKTNVEGTRLLVNTARSIGVRRFVFFSTINVYGTSDPHTCFDENASACPGDAYSRSKIKAEKIVLDAGQWDPDTFSVVVLRVAAVYGKGMKGNYNILTRYLKKGGPLLLGSGENRRTLIFDKDLAQAALLALEHPGASGQIYNITDGYVHTFNEIVHAMCSAMGINRRFIRIPEPVIQGILRCFRHENFRFNPLERWLSAMKKQMESLAVSGEKIQTELNFAAQYDLNRGWHDVLSTSAVHNNQG